MTYGSLENPERRPMGATDNLQEAPPQKSYVERVKEAAAFYAGAVEHCAQLRERAERLKEAHRAALEAYQRAIETVARWEEELQKLIKE